MSLSTQQKRLIYKWLLDEGCSIEYGRLSLCDLTNFRHSNVYDNRRYQVHSEDSKYPWSKIYDEIEPAVNKFIELRTKVRRMK